MKRAAALFLCLLMIAGCMTACKKAPQAEPVATAEPSVAPPSVAPAEPAPSPSPSPSPSPEVYTGPVNPLTGERAEKDTGGMRPYACMINNISVAVPQHGISRADIIYECLAEGGITRMMAIFQDVYDVGVVGSIRSARHYYVDIADSYDAVFLHAGGSPQGYARISELGIDHIDGVNGPGDIFYRDSWRMDAMGYEHSLMFDSSRIPAYEEDYGIDPQHAEGFESNLRFTEDGTPASGEKALTLQVVFSSGKTTGFEYDEKSKTYGAFEYGSEYYDAENDQQVKVTNILVLYAPVSNIEGDEKGRLDIDTVGSGDGYFACGGKCIPITWSRESRGQFEYFTANGKPLQLGVGKSYIAIVPDGSDVELG